jgi:hypothetical protein
MAFIIGLVLGAVATSAVWYFKGDIIKGFIDGLLKRK